MDGLRPRPAGISESESDSEDDYVGYLTPAEDEHYFIPHYRRAEPEPKELGGHIASNVSVKKPQPPQRDGASIKTCKQKNLDKLEEAKKLEKRFDYVYGKFKPPQDKPEYQEYFRSTRQMNLGLHPYFQKLVGDFDPIYVKAVHGWNVSEVGSYFPNLSKQEEQELDDAIFDAAILQGYYRDVPYFLVKNAESFGKMLKVIKLSKQSVVAIDLENNTNSFKNTNNCLVQLSIPQAAFVIDSFKCRELIKEQLKPIMESRKVLKLMVDCRNDCKQLRKDFQIEIIGVLDLQILFKKFRPRSDNNDSGLMEMCEFLLNDYEKVPPLQLQNYARRDLPLSLIEYAAHDAIILFPLWKKLLNVVNQEQYEESFKEGINRILMPYTVEKKKSPMEDLKLARVVEGKANQNQIDIYEALHKWREMYANQKDENPHNICSTATLWKLSTVNWSWSKKEGRTARVMYKDLRKCGVPIKLFPKQGNMILKICNENPAHHVQRMQDVECHNCFNKGHIARECSFLPDENRLKTFFNRPENRELKLRHTRARNDRKLAKALEDGNLEKAEKLMFFRKLQNNN